MVSSECLSFIHGSYLNPSCVIFSLPAFRYSPASSAFIGWSHSRAVPWLGTLTALNVSIVTTKTRKSELYTSMQRTRIKQPNAKQNVEIECKYGSVYLVRRSSPCQSPRRSWLDHVGGGKTTSQSHKGIRKTGAARTANIIHTTTANRAVVTWREKTAKTTCSMCVLIKAFLQTIPNNKRIHI